MGMVIGVPGFLIMLAAFICTIVFGIILIVKAATKKPKKAMVIATSISGGAFILGIILFVAGIATTYHDISSYASSASSDSSIETLGTSSSSSDVIVTNKQVPSEVADLEVKLAGPKGWIDPNKLKVTKEKYADGYKYVVEMMNDTQDSNFVNAILNGDGTQVVKYSYSGSTSEPIIELLTGLNLFNDQINKQISSENNKSNETYQGNGYIINIEIDPNLDQMAFQMTLNKQ